MKQKLLFILCLFASKLLIGQTINRVEVDGVMYANANDIEGVTIYNKSSSKGTITNQNGEFILEVAENDVIEISALQFEKQTVTITKDVVASKSLKIYLVEHVNQLNAVLLRHGLSGNLAVDINNVEIPPKIEMNFGSMDAVEFDEMALTDNRVARGLNSVMNNHELQNGINIIGIASMLFKQKKRTSPDEKPKFEKPVSWLDVYSQKFISDTFSIPMERVDEFTTFVENNGLSQELLKDKQEFDRIDFLVKQSELFLMQQDVKK